MVAPLDWGMGHTTRCVPLMAHLSAQGHTVIFAGNEAQRKFIQATFDNITAIHLEGYSVHYTTSELFFMPAILKQVPKILSAIRREHEWLKNIVAELGIDAVISDNRYGLYHASVPCVIMTHQLQIKTGLGRFADSILRKLHYPFLQKFNDCWIVDVPKAPGLAGSLSHPHVLPGNATYMGLLSQMDTVKVTTNGYLLVLLSGPEPQRSILSDKIWEQLKNYSGNVFFVEGSSTIAARTDIPTHISYYRQLVKNDLEKILSGADMVICRSGYSTLMDLVKLNKKAILIPTPGQTEQEYLGKELYKQSMYICKSQTGFNLVQSLEQAANILPEGNAFEGSYSLYKMVMDNWLAGI